LPIRTIAVNSAIKPAVAIASQPISAGVPRAITLSKA